MKFPVDYCFHCHTYRCGHAFGTDEDYVLQAIENGIKILIFTDHAPIPNFKQPGMRMNPSQLNGYLHSIRKLKDKYKDKITIYVGLECEYSDDVYDFYKELLDSKKVDLLIQGQHGHFHDGQFFWHFDEFQTVEEGIIEYKNEVIKGMRSGLFTYLAHPDLYINPLNEFNDFAKAIAKEILTEAIKNDIVVEINCMGARNSNLDPGKYPNKDFWEYASTFKGLKTTIGIDAHSSYESFSNHKFINYVLEIAKAAKLKPISDFKTIFRK